MKDFLLGSTFIVIQKLKPIITIPICYDPKWSERRHRDCAHEVNFSKKMNQKITAIAGNEKVFNSKERKEIETNFNELNFHKRLQKCCKAI